MEEQIQTKCGSTQEEEEEEAKRNKKTKKQKDKKRQIRLQLAKMRVLKSQGRRNEIGFSQEKMVIV